MAKAADSKTQNYQCPACGGPLHFDSKSGKLKCDYCDSMYSIEEAKAALDPEARASQSQTAKAEAAAPDTGRDGETVWSDAEVRGLRAYTCSSCGAELVCDAETAATSCPYCGNPTVLGGQLAGKLRPEYIIPFALDRKEAISALTNYYKGKVLLPKAFSSQNHIQEIKGVYVPFWLYDAEVNVQGKYVGHVSETHREGDYIVTTTQHYDVQRDGNTSFVRVPVDGSTKMPDAHMDAIEPFDYSAMVPFSTVYLPGYLADRYDQSDKECASRAEDRMTASATAALHSTLTDYEDIDTSSESVRIVDSTAHYALLPVWMLHTRWKDKDFLFAMNGQTGKLIGDLPIDKGRLAACFAAISLPLMVILAILLM